MWNGKHKQKLPWGTDSQSDLLDLRVQEWYHQSPEGQNKIKTKQTKKRKKTHTHTISYKCSFHHFRHFFMRQCNWKSNCFHKHFLKVDLKFISLAASSTDDWSNQCNPAKWHAVFTGSLLKFTNTILENKMDNWHVTKPPTGECFLSSFWWVTGS